MDLSANVKKTAKGEEEIQSRAHGLDRNLRYVLILVDGESTVEQLLEKGKAMENVEQSLRTLAQEGYIAVDGESSGSGAGVSVAEVKDQLISMARELLGGDAEKVVNKLKGAPDSKDGILEVTNSCKKLVKLMIDEKKAELLEQRCRAILDNL